MTTTQIQIAGLMLTVSLSLLIAIFRNQLAAVGNKLSARRKDIWKKFLVFIRITALYLVPTFWIIYFSIFYDFGKLYVLVVSINLCSVVINLTLELYKELQSRMLRVIEGVTLAHEGITNAQEYIVGAYDIQKEIVKVITMLSESQGVNQEIVKTLETQLRVLNDEIEKLDKKHKQRKR